MKFRNVIYPDPGPFLEYIGGSEYRLSQDFRVMWTDERGAEQTYKASAGMVFDRSSIPQIIQSAIPKDGPKLKPSTIHDHMYETKPAGWTRRDADRLFLAGLKAVGEEFFDRNIMYAAVRLFGGRVWRT